MKKLLAKFAAISMLIGMHACQEPQDVDMTIAITTNPVTEITNNSAVSGGTITSDGGSSITMRGVCYGLSPDPTIQDTHTEDGKGVGEYASLMEGLEPGNIYYVRAYATNSRGIVYGNELSFTIDAVVPVVTTLGISDITVSSAVVSGALTSEGGSTVTSVGVCYGTAENPTVEGNKVEGTLAHGQFSVTLEGLESGVTYYVRAYATNSVGTAYGEQNSFTPEGDPEVNISDEVFKQYALTNFDANQDGKLVKSEALLVERIDLTNLDVSSFEGIKNFSNLTELVASGTKATSIDVSGMSNLYKFICNQCPNLTSVNLDNCTSLWEAQVFQGILQNISVRGCNALVHFHVFVNQLKNVDLTDCVELQYMNISENQLETLNVTNNTKLVELFANNGKYPSLDVSNHTSLVKLDVQRNPNLTALNVSGCTALQYFYGVGTSIASYDFRGLTELLEFFAYDSTAPIQETKFDGCDKVVHIQYGMNLGNTEVSFSNLPALKTLIVWGTNMTKLSVSNLPALELLNLDVSLSLTELQISECPNIKRAQMCAVAIPSIDFTALTNLEFVQVHGSPELKSIIFGNNPKLTEILCHEGTGISTLDISKCAFEMRKVDANNPNIQSITMKTGQTVNEFYKTENVNIIYVD